VAAPEQPQRPAHRIVINVQFPDGHTSRLGLPEGRTATIENEVDGRKFSVNATITDLSIGAVAVRFAERSRLAGVSGETDTIIRDMALNARARTERERAADAEVQTSEAQDAYVEGFEQPFRLSVVGIDLPKAAPSASCSAGATNPAGGLFRVEPNLRCTQCCISCDGWRFCGCAVEACGVSCCCNDCCI